MPEVIQKHWDPELFARVETLEWKSRVLVEGFLQGLHRSRLRGFSSEFAQYHPYIHGDDLRYIDWRAFGRLDRLYIRQFESETNLRCQLLMDVSGSMSYRSERSCFQKHDFAALLAASMIRLLQTQRDACGVTLVRDSIVDHLPPRLSLPHFFRCLGALEKSEARGSCHLLKSINAFAEMFPKRGLIILFTDGWDDLEVLEQALQRLRYDSHEIGFFQIADPEEMDFSFSDSLIFEDMESGVRLPITPDWVRNKYHDRLRLHQEKLIKICRNLGVMHHLVRTDASPFAALSEFLAMREIQL